MLNWPLIVHLCSFFEYGKNSQKKPKQNNSYKFKCSLPTFANQIVYAKFIAEVRILNWKIHFHLLVGLKELRWDFAVSVCAYSGLACILNIDIWILRLLCMARSTGATYKMFYHVNVDVVDASEIFCGCTTFNHIYHIHIHIHWVAICTLMQALYCSVAFTAMEIVCLCVCQFVYCEKCCSVENQLIAFI